MRSKVFDISTIKGMREAERFKAFLENNCYKVTLTSVGLTRLRISGKPEVNP